MTEMYKARLNTPGIQYWVKTYDRISEKLELTNITADAMIFNSFDIPFLEETLDETFEGKYIVEESQ
nr:MAG TPA: hypothetical protein [Caudoviricetes sp.]